MTNQVSWVSTKATSCHRRPSKQIELITRICSEVPHRVPDLLRLFFCHWYGFLARHTALVSRISLELEEQPGLSAPYLLSQIIWYYVKGRVEEGDGVLSALHGLPLDDLHVQAQRRDIFEAIEIENSQKPFSLVTLIWDNTGMPNLPILASVEGTNVC